MLQQQTKWNLSKKKEIQTRVPIQNILLDLGATACLSTPNNPNAWSRCCSLCRLLASTQHVMDHWSIRKIFITDHHFLFFTHDYQTLIWSLNVVFVSWLLVKASKMKREFHFVFAFFECQCSTDIIWCPTGAVKPLKQDIPHLFSSSGRFKQSQEYLSVLT